MIKIDKKITAWAINDKDKQDKSEKNDDSDRPTKIIRTSSPKRPKELPCDIHCISYKSQKWVALVGMLHGEPYELFAGHSSNLQLPGKLIKGKIVKTNRGLYDLFVDVNGDDLIIKDIIKVFDNSEMAWATRMISLSLRHGCKIKYIVEQLSKDGYIGDINKVLSRVLKKYVSDDELKKDAMKAGHKCSSCESTNITFSEGCFVCKNCGFSKCG